MSCGRIRSGWTRREPSFLQTRCPAMSAFAQMNPNSGEQCHIEIMERVKGIEPSSQACEVNTSRYRLWWPAVSPDATDRGGTQHRWQPPSLRRLFEGRVGLGDDFSSPRRHVSHDRREASYQMKVVALALPAVARSVDQSAHNGDAEPANRALFCRSIQIGR